MHTILRVTMNDVSMANSAIESGRLGQIIQKVSDLIKPESSFFYSEQGHRAGIFVFNMTDSSMIPLIAEPFFTELNAKVEFMPAMDAKELAKGLDSWSKQAPIHQSLS
ncbi:hypothetical protein ACJVC5_01065 [Peredibacter sp. HCB2-198]|uniref:hypothetical protein n=1 Tax=Peredibacter sp. HCB2-198 TaxID=3383025 RepID=UPI0038B615A6